jgi:hypothetical protein
MAFDSTTNTIYVANSGSNTVSVITATVVSVNPTSRTVGGTGSGSGFGFAPNATITLKMKSGTALSSIGTGPCTTDSSGAFSDCTFTITPVTGGAHTVYASDGTGTATTTYTVTSTVTLVQVATGVPGTTIKASGRGFATSTTVAVAIGGATSPSTCTTDARGSFSNCMVTIPTVYAFVASDGSGDTAQQ